MKTIAIFAVLLAAACTPQAPSPSGMPAEQRPIIWVPKITVGAATSTR